MQDPNPLPWGAQDRFQAHFIVRKNDVENPLATQDKIYYPPLFPYLFVFLV